LRGKDAEDTMKALVFDIVEGICLPGLGAIEVWDQGLG
jgi:hypothetical protein